MPPLAPCLSMNLENVAGRAFAYLSGKSNSSLGLIFIARASAKSVLTEGFIRAVSIRAMVLRVMPDLADRDSWVSPLPSRTSFSLRAKASRPWLSNILVRFTA